MHDIEVTIKVFQAEVDVVNFTPVLNLGRALVDESIDIPAIRRHGAKEEVSYHIEQTFEGLAQIALAPNLPRPRCNGETRAQLP